MQQSNEKQSIKEKDKQAKEQKKGGMGTGQQQHQPQQPNREGSKNTGQQQGNKNQNMENSDPAEDMGSGRRQDDN